MRASVPSLLAGAFLFFLGWLTASLTTGGSSDPALVHHASEHGVDVEQLVACLDRIEALIRAGRAIPEQAPAPLREPVEQAALDVEQKLDALQAKLDQLASHAAFAAAGLDELSRAKPEPDQKALLALREQSSKDPDLVENRIIGIDYREATAAFGTPSKKRSIAGIISTSAGNFGPGVAQWIWDVPSAAVVLVVCFEQGKAVWAYFGNRATLYEK